MLEYAYKSIHFPPLFLILGNYNTDLNVSVSLDSMILTLALKR